MRLITIEETVLMDGRNGERRQDIFREHIVTQHSLPAVIDYFNRYIEQMCARYIAVKMGGWYAILSVVELGSLDVAAIHQMQSRHFSGYFLDGEFERIPFDLVTEQMLFETTPLVVSPDRILGSL